MGQHSYPHAWPRFSWEHDCLISPHGSETIPVWLLATEGGSLERQKAKQR